MLPPDAMDVRALSSQRRMLYLSIPVLIASCTGQTATPKPSTGHITPFIIDAPNALEPSPDGRLLLAQNLSDNSLTLFTRLGKVLGKYQAPAPPLLMFRWLHDSTGVAVWAADGSAPLQTLNQDGKVKPCAIAAQNASESPDGKLIASTRAASAAGPSRIELGSRDGRLLRVLATGPDLRLLGWLGAQIVYVDRQNIYTISPAGGAPRSFAPVPYLYSDLREPASGPSPSPDGTVLIISNAKEEYAELVSNQLFALPLPVVHSSAPVIWIGPHAALGFGSPGALETVDMVTGRVQARAHIDPNASIQAVSGQFVAWTLNQGIYLTNLTSGQTVFAGMMPVSGLISPLGDGSFLLHGEGRSFIIRDT
jgi:hypothetical protein